MGDKGNIKTYHFAWNGRNKYIDASTYSEARRKFMERFGLFPDPELVFIGILEDQ